MQAKKVCPRLVAELVDEISGYPSFKEHGEIWAGQQRIGLRLGVQDRQVRRAVRALVELDLLRVQRKRGRLSTNNMAALLHGCPLFETNSADYGSSPSLRDGTRVSSSDRTGTSSNTYGGEAQKYTSPVGPSDARRRETPMAKKLSGLATGLTDLDVSMGGLQPSDLIILAGRPGMGKTALATNIAYNVAKAWRGERRTDGHMATLDGGIVGFFSLEMSAEQLATRIIGERTAIAANKIRRGDLKEIDYEKIKQISAELHNLPLYIDQTGGLSIGQVAAQARRLKRQRGLDLLVIDYLQLLQASKRSGRDNRVKKLLKSPPASKPSPRNSTFRSSRYHSCRGRWSCAIINDRSSPICASPAQLNRTPTSCACIWDRTGNAYLVAF